MHAKDQKIRERSVRFLPICDALFGTSDLRKGLWGTLFHGSGHATMGEEERRVLGVDTAAPGVASDGAQQRRQHHDS